MIDGFILTSNVKTSNDRSYLELAGQLKDGRPFLWLNSKPYLCGFIPEGETLEYSEKKHKNKFTSFQDHSLDLIYFANLYSLRKETNKPNSKLLEGDVEPSHRFLMENKIKGNVSFLSEGIENEKGVVVFENPKIKPGSGTVSLKTLSIDIEIGVKSKDFLDAEKNPLYSIAYTDGQVNKVLMISDQKGRDDYIEYFKDEPSLIKAFIRDVQQINPQVFIGWNVINFDFHFLIKKCEKYEISFDLGVNHTPIDSFLGRTGNDLYMFMNGRVVLDGIPMMRLMKVELPNYKLDTAANLLLGKGKTITGTNDSKVEEIENYFLNDKKRLAEYNLIDTQLVFDIYKKLDIVKFQQFRVKFTGVLMDKLTSETTLFDSIYLPPLHSLGYAAPHVSGKSIAGRSSPQIVKNNYFQHVFCLNFEYIDAYATLFYKIDPLGRIWAEKKKKDFVSCPSGLQFHRNKTILPKLIEHYLYLKEKYKKNQTLSLAIDNLIKLASTAVTKETCRFYSPALTSALNSVTKLFRDVASNALKDNGYNIAYEERECLYVSNNFPTSEEEIERLIKIISEHLKKKLLDNKVINEKEKSLNWRLPIKKGSAYEHFFITQIGVENNSRPVYLTNTQDKWTKSENLVIGDTVELYALFEKDLFSAIFHKQNPLDVIKNYLKKINQGECDDKLFYRKKIVKHLDKYEEPHPIHIQAARKVPNFSSKWIECVATLKGGEAKGHVVSTINYQQYINKFLKPLSEIALKKTVYEDALEDIFSGKPQMSLFGG